MKRALWNVQNRLRDQRADLFVRLVQPAADSKILDLGGAEGGFAEKIAARIPCGITVADVVDHSTEARRHGFSFVRLDANADRLPFADQEFDLVLCNSVIEHVTLPREECLRTDHREAEWRARAWESQQRFASELRRVAHGYFVQTPHRDFPIELHTWLPGVNWLPHNHTQKIVRFMDRWWVKQCGCADWNLLRPAQMQTLFPDSTLHIESLAGLPKSIIAFVKSRP